MKPRLSDRQRIAKKKCQSRGCSDKAVGIFKNKFLCRRCYSKVKPTAIDRRLYNTIKY